MVLHHRHVMEGNAVLLTPVMPIPTWFEHAQTTQQRMQWVNGPALGLTGIDRGEQDEALTEVFFARFDVVLQMTWRW